MSYGREKPLTQEGLSLHIYLKNAQLKPLLKEKRHLREEMDCNASLTTSEKKLTYSMRNAS